MSTIVQIFSNRILLCAIFGWFSAQVIKFIICLIVNRKIDLTKFFASGGMPSSHSSFVCALAASVAKYEGVESPFFAVAVVLACVVMYDASGVRRASGEHAKVLNRLVQNISDMDQVGMDKDLKELIGHTPLEVIAGACLGVFIVLLF